MAKPSTHRTQPQAVQADWSSCALGKDEFVSIVREEGRAHYRDLPWRNLDDPYAVLVSEVMLQQTQVSRVLGYWQRWMAAFPTVDALAAASTSDVLEQWQGLGYNRRALALKRTCDICSSQYGGQLPNSVDKLVELPGIGPATAAGVVAFAYDQPAVYIETNVRSVFLHHLFPDRDKVSDRQLMPFVADACPDAGVRSWYYALLDYGSFLKTQVANPARRSAHYARQSPFAGSHREKRSFVLRCVLSSGEGISVARVAQLLDQHEQEAGRERVGVEMAAALVAELLEEGFFHESDGLLAP